MIGSLENAVEEKVLRGTEQLARFFPEVRAVAVPAVVELLRGGSVGVRDVVSIEFAGAEVAIFTSALPLEFEDRIRMENDRGQAVEGQVVAVRYHQGTSGVAIRIQDGPFSWMKRP